jgi:D-alanyl-lipoteichoic acid acyltransferase DltB (MBOAT superfamily)
MLFNSIDFAIFLPLLFLLYWSINKYDIKYQNILILVASYVFYGWWDWRFLSLIIFSTLIDFSVGKKLAKSENEITRRRLLYISILINIGLLGFFKYYNFFADNFIEAFSFFGTQIQPNTLDIILPVGISFYTFQTLSYTIDIYRKKLKPTDDIIAFGAFVSFFPQLVAGPIERASNLLPQFFEKRKFHYSKAVDGCRQILWGLFKKMVIADNCATFANQIFNDYEIHSGSTLFLGAVFFAFQIYGDFSGYSDIAIGTSRLFGFSLKQNFAFPYFSRDIAEFWRRWHISLSTWFRDYLYIPLGGSRVSKPRVICNVFIVFLVSGFWHGANWTFLAWGLLHAVYFLPLLILNRNRVHTDIVSVNKNLPSLKEFLQIGITFFITVIAWVFFRAENISHAFEYLGGIFSLDLFSIPAIRPSNLFFFLLLFLVIEWFGRQQQYALEYFWLRKSKFLRWALYLVLVFLILLYMKKEETAFIYFQF